MDYFEAESPLAPFIIDGLFREGQLVLLAGNFAVGKTPVLADWGVSVSKGLKWCGRQCYQHPVIVIDFESHPGRFKTNYKNVCQRLGITLPRVPNELDIYLEHDTDANATALLNIIKKDVPTRIGFLRSLLANKPNAVIVLDPIELLFPLVIIPSLYVSEIVSRSGQKHDKRLAFENL